MLAVTASWASASFWSCTRRLVRLASAPLSLSDGVLQLLLELRVAELENDAAGGDHGAGPQDDALDAADVVAGIQRMSSGTSVPMPAHLAQHRARA